MLGFISAFDILDFNNWGTELITWNVRDYSFLIFPPFYS